MSPISSRKIVPPSASFELAARLPVGAREGALLVAEQLAFQQRLGQRRAGDRDEGFGGAVAGVVDRARHQLLARAALALDEHGAAQAGNLARQLEDLLHARVLGDDVAKVVLAGQLFAQDGVLALQVLDLDDARHQQRDLFRIAGLDDVLLGALFHRLNGRVHGGVRGDDDDGSVRVQRRISIMVSMPSMPPGIFRSTK